MSVSNYYIEKLAESKWNQDWESSVTDPNLVKVPLCKFTGKIPKNITYEEYRTNGLTFAVEQQEAFGLHYHDRYNEGKLTKDTLHYNVFAQMADHLGLEEWTAVFHNQIPGQMHMLHMDTLYSGGRFDYLGDKRREKIKRVFIMLEDWKPGQVIMFGGEYHYNWKKGDVMYFSWPDMPHGTANFGHHERLMLMMTGLDNNNTFSAILDECPVFEIK